MLKFLFGIALCVIGLAVHRAADPPRPDSRFVTVELGDKARADDAQRWIGAWVVDGVRTELIGRTPDHRKLELGAESSLEVSFGDFAEAVVVQVGEEHPSAFFGRRVRWPIA